MATIYYDNDADLGLITRRKVAIIGYGSMGREVEKVLLDRGHAVACRVDPGQAAADAPQPATSQPAPKPVAAAAADQAVSAVSAPAATEEVSGASAQVDAPPKPSRPRRSRRPKAAPAVEAPSSEEPPLVDSLS